MAKKKVDKVLGVADLAKVMGLEAQTVRIKLRDAKVKKAGKSYSWKTPAEVQAVAKKLAA